MLSAHQQTYVSSAEIRTVIAASRVNRVKGPAPLPESVRTYVLGKLPSGWEVKENVKYNPKRPNPSNLNISITGTSYQLFIEAPARDGDFCKISSVCVQGDKRSRLINELCTTTEMMDDILSNVTERIQTWETKVKPILKEFGFTMMNEGQYDLALNGGITLQALPSLFPNCDCMLLRKRPHHTVSLLCRFIDAITCYTRPTPTGLPDLVINSHLRLPTVLAVLKSVPHIGTSVLQDME